MSQRNRIASILIVGLFAPLAAPAGFWCGNIQQACPLDDAGRPTCYQPPPPNPACEVCESCTRSPCYVGSGVYTTSAVDLEIPTAGFPLSLARSYSSHDRFDGPLGVGWSSSLLPRAHLATFLFSAPNVVQSEANIAMPNGARYRFNKNSNGSFTPPDGRHDTLVRNADGSFDLALQRSRSGYHFNVDSSIASMSDDFGNRLDYTYDVSGVLTRIADAAGSGRYFDVFWGADGRLSAIVDHTGRSVEYRYDSGGKLIEVTDPLGRLTSYHYVPGKFVPLVSQIRDNWGRVISTITYDSADRVTSYTENGETWTYAYAYQGALNKTAKADSLGNTYVFTYDANGLVTSEVAPGGAMKSTVYYPDGSAQLVTNEVGAKAFNAYDSEGRLLSTTEDYQGSLAIRFDYSYDTQFPNSIASIVAKDPATGEANLLYQAQRFEYWPPGSAAPGALHKVKRVQSDGATLDILATYSYDSKGRLVSVEDGSGAGTDYSYDYEGNRISIVAPANSASGSRPVTTYTYDELGRVATETNPSGGITSYVYDAIGRVLSITLPSPSADAELEFTTSFGYDEYDSSTGLVFVTTTDANDVVTKRGEDVFGRTRKSVDGLGGVTQRTYSRDLLSSLTDANGNTTSYSYDARKRLRSTNFANGEIETNSYFANGALSSVTDRENQTVSYAYDRLGRMSAKTYPNSSTITFSYAGPSLSMVVDTSVTPSEVHSFSYDGAYRLASETQGERGTIQYEYLAGDRLASYSVLNGETAAYGYYPNGSVSFIEWSAVPGVFEFSYNTRGQTTQIKFPNGQSRNYGYDALGRTLEVANIGPGGENLASFRYGYDVDSTTGLPQSLGLRTSLMTDFPAEGFSNALTRYYYDAEYRLIRVEYPDGPPFNGEMSEWSYDLIGNRTSATTGGVASTYSYETVAGNENNWQRLLSDGANSYTYDDSGNMVTKTGLSGSYSFTINADIRLAVISGSQTSSYSYDFKGRRTSSSEGGTVTAYLYRGLDLIGAYGSDTASYLFGSRIDQPLMALRNGEALYFVVDALGSVVASNSTSGVVRHSATFDAWGAVKAENGTREYPFTYTGREVAGAETIFNRARYYSPGIGRFVSEDPIRFRAGPNFYTYAMNAPLRFTDPLGLDATESLPTPATAMPGERPSGCGCDRTQIRSRKERVEEILALYKENKLPAGKFGGANTKGATCDYATGWCSQDQDPVRFFDPPCPETDPCLRYCCRKHEWFHFVDNRPYNWNWEYNEFTIFLEMPAYTIELECVKSYL